MYQSGFREAEPAGPYTEVYDKELAYGIAGADLDCLSKTKMSRAEKGKIMGRVGTG